MSKWYVYRDDEVIGPFATDELVGQIEADTMVCPAGSEEWSEAQEVEELQEYVTAAEPPPAAPETETKKSDETSSDESAPEKPTLNKLKVIAQQATNEELEREYNEFWDKYDSQEKRIIRNEMVTRNLWEDVAGTEEDEEEVPI